MKKTTHVVITGIALALLLAFVPAAGGDAGLGNPIETTIQSGPIQVGLDIVARGMTAPEFGINSPLSSDANRLFVTDQNGILWDVNLTTGTKRVFLDLSGQIVQLGIAGPGTFDERGLLAVAFSPDYASNGLIYTFQTEPFARPADFTTLPPGTIPENGQSVISEWHVPDPASPNSKVDPTSERELLRIDKPQFNHNGATLFFGPQDRRLYVSLGDGGAADDQGPGHNPATGNGQDLTTVLGKVLRIDPNPAAAGATPSANGRYSIPNDNPFVGTAGARHEIWAFGLRNPFRYSFDTGTTPARLILADVGQNDIEEVDVIQKGKNYGWRVKEGSFLFDPNGADPGFVTANSPGSPAGLTDPIAEYDHDEGVAVVGGFVYHGANPGLAALRGRYVFGDFARRFNNHGRLFEIDPNRVTPNPADNTITELTPGPLSISLLGFGQDARGELYVLGNATGTPFGATGVVLRIRTPCPNNSGDNVVCND